MSETVRENEERSRAVIVGVGTDEWAALLDDDVRVEFPYAESLGGPTEIRGKQALMEYVAKLLETVKGITMFDLVATSSADDLDLLFVEYKGHYGIAPDVTHRYIGMHRWRDGKLIAMREYWNPASPVRKQRYED